MGIFIGIVAALIIMYFLGKRASEKRQLQSVTRIEYYTVMGGSQYIAVIGNYIFMTHNDEGDYEIQDIEHHPEIRNVINSARKYGQPIRNKLFEASLPKDKSYRDAYWKAVAVNDVLKTY